jgi:flagellar biosynthesis protein FliP
MKPALLKLALFAIPLVLFCAHFTVCAEEQPAGISSPADPAPIQVSLGDGPNAPRVSSTISMLLTMTLMAFLPALLMMTTSFARIIIVLGFLRQAMGTQQSPPNTVLIGVSLFLTLFIMSPVFNRMNDAALTPYNKGEVSGEVAIERGLKPLREFMGQQTRKKDLALMVELSRLPQPESFEDIPTTTLIPAFMLSELRTAFQMGFLLFLPFIIIDMVVASVLMSLGMVMLPPAMVSLPLKLLLFVVADGWFLIVRSLTVSFTAASGG